MKRFALPIALIALLAVATGVASAQTAPAQTAQVSTRQQNQNNRLGQMAGAMVQNAAETLAAQSDPLQLIFRKDVQRDLKLDLAARNRFANLRDKQAAELATARRQNRRNPTNLSEVQEKQRKETQDKIDELLTDAQKKRLKEISYQLMGESCVLMSDVQKAIGATPDQVQRFTEIQAQRDRKVVLLQSEIQNGAVRPADVATQLKSIQSEMNEQLAGVLEDDQKEKLKGLFGEPFVADKA